ncbi:prepilin-type N-terminal cleavage/methylation domain-containing protein [Methylomonas sp. AM2-LC]|uniref:prepilin-type N-terminal cleavage/methylation domain-containing protein n=1 Tax=Methylomonas sp. AM2-LC TaxID=3153301 RepID=UPI003266471C
MRLSLMRHQNGVTLIELIMSMMIISITIVGLFSVMNITNRHSADPIVTHQAIALAESYMDEILQQSYSGTASNIRATYNNVDNYNNLTNSPPQTQQGTSISNLSAYSVSVSVSTPVTLNGGVLAKQITVSVSGPGNTLVTLVGYRASY